MESVRQQKIASLIQKTISEIILKESGLSVPGGMVTITEVKMTPDLLVARIYLSVFKAHDANLVVANFKEHKAELRKKLGDKLRFQLRRIPALEFYLDDTLDEVFRLEEIFRQIKKDTDKK